MCQSDTGEKVDLAGSGHKGPCQAAFFLALFLCIDVLTMSRLVGYEGEGPYRLHALCRVCFS